MCRCRPCRLVAFNRRDRDEIPPIPSEIAALVRKVSAAGELVV